MSPSQHALQRGNRLDKAGAARRKLSATKSSKLRRRQLRESRGQTQAVSELREGTTYASACASSADLDTEKIPDPLTPPAMEKPVSTAAVKVVYFDLETTGLARASEILQIAALTSDGKSFSRYEQLHPYW